MKFRNPETGEVLTYRDIIPIFCKNGCDNCPIIAEVLNHHEQSCQAWIAKYPHKAAALIGYEVVVDETVLTKNDSKDESLEANMDKPRICKVLGVEVGQKFTISDTGYWIEKNGAIFSDGNQRDLVGVSLICDVVNHPDRIIRKPRFTQQDIDNAKMIKTVFGKNGTIKRYDKATTEPYSTLTFNNIYINENMFPNIKEGQECSLDEIIGKE